MLILYLVILVAVCWPSIHLWILYRRSPKQKPKAVESVGILLCTAVMVGCLAVLMYRNWLF